MKTLAILPAVALMAAPAFAAPYASHLGTFKAVLPWLALMVAKPKLS
jgi:hypothetical protein